MPLIQVNPQQSVQLQPSPPNGDTVINDTPQVGSFTLAFKIAPGQTLQFTVPPGGGELTNSGPGPLNLQTPGL